MYSDSRAPVGTLEYIRRNRGVNACKRRFQEIIGKQKEAAPRLLNDEGLRFATLFSLKPQIEESGLKDGLSEKNRAALQICDKVLEEKRHCPAAEFLIRTKTFTPLFYGSSKRERKTTG